LFVHHYETITLVLVCDKIVTSISSLGPGSYIESLTTRSLIHVSVPLVSTNSDIQTHARKPPANPIGKDGDLWLGEYEAEGRNQRFVRTFLDVMITYVREAGLALKDV
jgi:hypothetical protein